MANYELEVAPGNRGVAVNNGRLIIDAGDIIVVTEEERDTNLAGLISQGVLIDNGTTSDPLTYGGTTGGGGGGGVVAPASFPPFSVAGVLSPTVFGPRMYSLADVTVTRVLASADTPPTGAALVFDLLLNGDTSIFGETKPSIAAGTDLADVPVEAAIAEGDYLKLEIISVGSETPGSDLTVQMGL